MPTPKEYKRIISDKNDEIRELKRQLEEKEIDNLQVQLEDIKRTL